MPVVSKLAKIRAAAFICTRSMAIDARIASSSDSRFPDSAARAARLFAEAATKLAAIKRGRTL